VRHIQVTFPRLVNPIKLLAYGSVAVALLLGGLAAPRAIRMLAKPRGARYSPAQVAARMLAAANAYESPASLATIPEFHDGFAPLPQPGAPSHRRVWQADIHANGQLIDLIVNDKDGNVMAAFNVGNAASTSSKSSPTAPVLTAAQAARLSLNVARRLAIIPAGAQAALAVRPEDHGSNERWYVTWRVRNSPTAPEYPVVVTLRQRDGRLLAAANGAERLL
jgi:hypothetical protein